VNLIEDLMERSPASRLGIVSLDTEGARRDRRFGALVANSAAAGGVECGDVVVALVGNQSLAAFR
jgi:hypothetical protein